MIPAEIVIAASEGRRVFPVTRGDKVPLVKWRSEDPSSSDLEQIQKWWIRYGDCNWGMETGAVSGVFVIDTDSKEGYDWVVENGLTDTYVVKTGGLTPAKMGYGFHFYFAHPGGGTRIKNSVTDLSPGVDVRGDGGYVLMPPSRTEMPYYVARQAPIAVAPAWLVERLTAAADDHAPRLARAGAPLCPQDVQHGMNIYRKACRLYPETPDGQWNIELNNLAGLAGRMVAAGVLDDDAALNLAREHGAAYLKDDRKAFMATWRSGFKWGLTSPWVPLGPEDIGFAGGIPAPPSAPASSGLRNMASVVMRPINWLWPGWLPKGKLVMYAGPGGVGKSSVAFSFASIISRGSNWPDGLRCPQGRVLIWSGEDDCADTVAPRLTAMGADMSRVDMLPATFDPSRDFAALKLMFRPGEIALLIIDPIVNAVAGDMNKANEVRRGLQGIVDFANDLDCCVVGISHFNKGSGGKNATERVTGSQAFTAFARMTLVGQRDQSAGECVIARAKSNISVDTGGFKYRIEPTSLAGGIETTRIAWGSTVEGSATDILGEIEPQEEKVSGSTLRKAKEFLEIALSKQPIALKVLIETSEFTEGTLLRARRQMKNIVISKQGKDWFWSIPFGEVRAPE